MLIDNIVAEEPYKITDSIVEKIMTSTNYSSSSNDQKYVKDVKVISNYATAQDEDTSKIFNTEYENKIMIWASPLEFELRGSHRWLQNVITHEFVHIISLQKSMKYGTRVPGFYLQYMDYENEKRPDVLYGYPNTLISYPIPGTSVPPWLAEGIAQFMYDDDAWDHWDNHRSIQLRKSKL